ncbi:MAG: lytic transglycosylase domain-containing protein [Alphaproteobacteria bacterium]
MGMKRTIAQVCGLLLAGVCAVAAPARASNDGSLEWSPWNETVLPSDQVAARPATVATRDLPKILSAADEAAYRDIFRLQEAGNWAAADQIIRRLDEDTLMGDVLAQRFLSQKGYRAGFPELQRWMEDYPDHPDAEAIHALARQRGGKKAEIESPLSGYLFGGGGGGDGTRWGSDSRGSYRHLSEAQKKQVDTIRSRFRHLLSRGTTDKAQAILDADETKKLLNHGDIDQMRSLLSFAYFLDGQDDQALKSAASAEARSGNKVPLAQWTAGLAAWRKGRMDQARRHFESLARSPKASSWMVAAGAYWAARSNLKARRPEVVNGWLDIAAQQPRTFYGLLARRALGLEIRFDWDAGHLTASDVDLLQESPSGRRALGLVQVGQTVKAERQLRKVYPTASEGEARAVVALAQQANMPALAISLAGVQDEDDGRSNDAARYPVPSWRPNGGWRIDRALVLAFVRQESGFNPGATSPSGALGLMQLLPSTASFIARSTGQGQAGRARLYEPETNLMLGQRYLEHLLEDPAINGNLLKMVAAYNAGPGNLVKWEKHIAHNDDPLLYMESMPFAETRMFVERVLTNFWMYCMRLNQPTPSLDAMASGDWPYYVQLDDQSRVVAENAGN